MQLARFLNSVFKKDGFILIDANSKSYIIGNPEKENPIKVKILNKNLHYKLLFHPDLYFGEAYTDGEIVIENGSLTQGNITMSKSSWNKKLKMILITQFLIKMFAKSWRTFTNIYYNI